MKIKGEKEEEYVQLADVYKHPHSQEFRIVRRVCRIIPNSNKLGILVMIKSE